MCLVYHQVVILSIEHYFKYFRGNQSSFGILKTFWGLKQKIFFYSDYRYYCPTEQLSDYTLYPCKEGYYCLSGATVPDPLDGITG